MHLRHQSSGPLLLQDSQIRVGHQWQGYVMREVNCTTFWLQRVLIYTTMADGDWSCCYLKLAKRAFLQHFDYVSYLSRPLTKYIDYVLKCKGNGYRHLTEYLIFRMIDSCSGPTTSREATVHSPNNTVMSVTYLPRGEYLGFPTPGLTSVAPTNQARLINQLFCFATV